MPSNLISTGNTVHIARETPALFPRVKFLVSEYKQYTKYKKYMVYGMMVNAKEKKQSVGMGIFSFYPSRFFAGLIIK